MEAVVEAQGAAEPQRRVLQDKKKGNNTIALIGYERRSASYLAVVQRHEPLTKPFTLNTRILVASATSATPFSKSRGVEKFRNLVP